MQISLPKCGILVQKCHIFLGFGRGNIRYSYGMNRVIYRLSNVYLSCIYRICNVVDSVRIEGKQVSFH